LRVRLEFNLGQAKKEVTRRTRTTQMSRRAGDNCVRKGSSSPDLGVGAEKTSKAPMTHRKPRSLTVWEKTPRKGS